MYGYIALGFVLGIAVAVVFARIGAGRRPGPPRLPPAADLSAPIAPGDAGWRGGAASVTLDAAGRNVIAVIKVVRDHTRCALKEAKDLVESAPRTIVTGISEDDAERFADDLRRAGASAVVR